MRKKCYLSEQDLQQFEGLTAASGVDALWSALGSITPFLGQRLCKVDEYVEEFHGSASLSTFHVRGRHACELYLLVRSDGTLVLGSVAQLAIQVKLVMAGFQPLADTLGTVLVTDQLRFGGSFHDILVVVHRSRPPAEPEAVLYHAEATWDGAKLCLNPVYSDPDQDRRQWQPVKADRLPTWFMRWPIHRDDRLPLHQTPMHLEQIERLDAELSGQIDALLCTPTVTCAVFADELRFFRHEADPTTTHMRDWIKGAAIAESGEIIQIIAACDNLQLVGQELGADKPLFKQNCHEALVTAAFCGTQDKGTGWRDFLVYFLDGTLHHLRLLPDKRLAKVCTQLWDHLGLFSLEAKQRFKDSWGKAVPPQEQEMALIRAVLDHFFEDGPLVAGNNTEVKDLIVWLNLDESDKLLQMVVEYILERFHKCTKSWSQDCYKGEKLLVALRHLYKNRFRLSFQDRVDRYFRSLYFVPNPPSPTFELMKWHADRNRDRVWLETQDYATRKGAQGDDGETPLEVALWQGKLGMERWVNAFWLADAWFVKSIKDRPLVGLIGLDECHLVMATRKHLFLSKVDPATHRLGELVEVPREGEGRDVIMRIAKLADNGLALATASGKLHFYVLWDDQLSQVQSLESPAKGAPWALAHVSDFKEKLLFVAFNEGRRSWLAPIKKNADVWSYGTIAPFALPKVRFLAIASTQDQVVIAKASTYAGVTSLCILNERGEVIRKLPILETMTGVTALAFDRRKDPRHLLVSDRQGFAYCLCLSDCLDRPAEVVWTFRCKATVRSICNWHYDGQDHFILGSDAGELVMLRAQDGCRIWKKTLNDPIRRFTPLEDNYLAVYQARGLISLYRPIDEKEIAFDKVVKVNEWIKSTVPSPQEREEKVWCYTDNQSLQAIFKRKHRERGYSYILDHFNNKEPRGRTIAYFARNQELDHLEDLLSAAKFRELYLLAAYLPESAPIWVIHKIWQALLIRKPDKIKGPNSEAAQMAAFSAILHRFLAHGMDLKAIQDLKMPPAMLVQPWPCLAYARLLIIALPVEQRFDSALFQKLSPLLFSMPPTLIRALVQLTPPDSQACKDFQLFDRTRQALLKSQAIPAADFAALRKLFLPFEGERSIGGLLYWHLVLTSVLRTVEAGQPWLELRTRFHQALGKIYQMGTVQRSTETSLIETFMQCIRNQLHAEPPVAETAALQVRLDWCDQFLRRLSTPKWEGVTGLIWKDELHCLADHLRKLLQHMLPLERDYLASEVRPRLELLKLERLYTGQVALHLRAIPEGHGELQRVTLVFAAKGEQGLREPGRLIEVRERMRYPGDYAQMEVVLTGFLRADQTCVCVSVATSAEAFPTRETAWDLDLKAHLLRQMGEGDLVQLLPAAYQWLQHHLPTERGAHIVVVDDPEQQRRMGQDWAQTHRGLLVDLDQLLADCGPGGVYAVGEISGDFVRARLINSLPLQFKAHGLPHSHTPICLAPFAVVGARWLEMGGRDLLRNLLNYFLEQNVRRERTWLLLLSGQIWRACGDLFERGQVLFPYALVRQHLREFPEGEASNQYRALLGRVTVKSDDLANLAGELNHDYRLTFLWMGWYQRSDARKRSMANFYESAEVRRFVLDELASLGVEEILVLLLGSIVDSQVQLKQLRAGMFIGEERFSRLADGKQGKRLHRPGDCLSEHDVHILRSVAGQGEVVIQGFGEGESSPEVSQLLRLQEMLLADRAKGVYRYLHRLGLVHFKGQWLRTLSPSYDFFKGLHQRYARDSDPIGSVFTEILGRGRFILENVTFDRLEQLTAINYRLGLAKNEDLVRLNQVRTLWQPGHSDPETILCRELGLRSPREEGPGFHQLEKMDYLVLLRGFAGEPGSFWCWLPDGAACDISQLVDTCQRVLAEYLAKLEKEDGQNLQARPKIVPRIILLGPGAEPMPLDEDRRVAILRQAHFLKSLYEGDLIRGLLGCVSSQLKLTALSPYQLSGPLAPGSPLFKGRSRELDYIKARIHEISTLIVGSRRVGKTSFLNQILYWTQEHPSVCPVYMDLQNARSSEDFRDDLAKVMLSPRNSHLLRRLAGQIQAVSELHEFVACFHRQGLLPIFLLNEVDSLVLNAPELIGAWRKLHEDHLARFIMVGYVSLLRLEDADSPLNHFTQGTSARFKAITLTALVPSAAAEILDQLESAELGLTWNSVNERQRAYQLCQKRSFCIPWVLQQMGHHIIESMERRREDRLSYDLVEEALNNAGDVVWNYISAINYHRMGLTKRPADEHGYKIILYGLVRKKYLMGATPAIKDEALASRDPLTGFGFTTAEAEGILAELMSELLVGREFEDLDRWLRELRLSDVLNLMTLTLVLEPDPNASDRFAFLMHILPMELFRHYPDDLTLDNLIVEEAKRFMGKLSSGG